MLDIVMTHYREPWSVGEKFFSMLDLQRGVNFDEIRVILVNDGDDELPAEHFENRPYRVDRYKIAHAGVSAARNEGLRRATDTWITFCDFDDMFVSVYSLKAVMDALHADNADFYDVLWTEFISEETKHGYLELAPRPFNTVFNHGKYYRRSAIIEHDIWFNEKIEFNEDSEFNSILYLALTNKRYGQIKNIIPIYTWICQNQSVTHSPTAYWRGRIGNYWRNKSVLAAYKRYEELPRYAGMYTRVCWDTYYTLNTVAPHDCYNEIAEDFKKNIAPYAQKYIDMVNADAELIEKIKNVSWQDYCAEKTDDFKLNESISFEDWMKGVLTVGSM